MDKTEAHRLIYESILKDIGNLEAEHPYRVPGKHETYDPYNQGWCDALDRVSQLLEVELWKPRK